MASRILAPIFLIAAAPALVAMPAFATEIPNWPCKAPYKESLTTADVWKGPPPPAQGDWRDDKDAHDLVTFAVNPENSPNTGRAKIRDYTAKLGADKTRGAGLVLQGLVDETNVLRKALIAGIRDLYIKADILGDAVKNDDAMLAEVPANEAQKRQDIQKARKTNFRNKDDAEEETDFTCYRLGYVEKKLRLLTEELQAQLHAQDQ